jgi:hypothetical protein
MARIRLRSLYLSIALIVDDDMRSTQPSQGSVLTAAENAGFDMFLTNSTENDIVAFGSMGTPLVVPSTPIERPGVSFSKLICAYVPSLF